MDIWVLSTFWLLWLMLLWTFICVQIFVWTFVFISLRYIPGSRIVDYIVTMFNLLGNCLTVLQSGCTILPFYQQCMRIPVSIQRWQLLLPVFLMIAIVVCHCGFDFALPWWIMMLMTTLSYAYRLFLYIPWRNVYSNPLSIWKLSCVLMLNCKCSLF